MGKRQSWFDNAWKKFLAGAAIIGFIASLLQIAGTVDFNQLFNALTSSVPAYILIIVVIIVTGIIIVIARLKASGRKKSNILDLVDARRLAILCQTPQTTEFLRDVYDEWERQSSWVVLGGYGFHDYMKRLQDEGYLVYLDGKWSVTPEALAYIRQYHGG